VFSKTYVAVISRPCPSFSYSSGEPIFPLSTWSDTPLEMEPCAPSTGARKRGCRMIKKQDVEKRRFWQRMIGRRRAAVFRFGSFAGGTVKGESVYCGSASSGRSTGTDIAQARNRPGSGELCAGQRRTGSNGRPASSSCWGTDVGCASARAWMRRPCERYWQPSSHRDAEFFRRPAKCICARYRATCAARSMGCP